MNLLIKGQQVRRIWRVAIVTSSARLAPAWRHTFPAEGGTPVLATTRRQAALRVTDIGSAGVFRIPASEQIRCFDRGARVA